ncbi:STS14 protein-like [Durio zibethinus]|uniref:STS14 protein-like n=1 Tax=Durio zibethinus TaxID=66656 RepID=A0A6P5ZHV1_DURZI|nr:STS14 protein-like [Durio zibethinus]
MANAFVAVLVLAICHSTAQGVASATSHGITAPAVMPGTAAREFLDAHNQARAEVRVGTLKWSEQLANATSRLARYQRNKMGCQIANLTGDKYGANQFWGGAARTPRMVVASWVKEKSYYDYASNSCAPNYKCGLYTQVVWKNSSELGCAQATCKDRMTFTICFYNPPGNYEGERPY